jgi:hypothetical protein
MGESGNRPGRTSVYRRSGWLAALTGAGVVAISLVMMLSPAASAANAAVILHAPYKGAVSPSTYLDIYGCAKAKVTKAFHFSLHTGIGAAASSGKASQCSKVVNGVGQTSDADYQVGAELALPLKLAPGTTSVTLNTATSAAVAITTTDGVRNNSLPMPACANGYSTVYENITEYEWNNFGSYNISELIIETGAYSYYDNYSYGTGAIPSPFNLNNTTYYYHDFYQSTQSDCTASAEYEVEQYGYLIDTTTGLEQFTNYTSSEDKFIDVSVTNETDFGSDGYYEWDEGYSYGSNSTTTFANNVTGSSIEVENCGVTCTFTSTPGTNNTQGWSSVGTTVNSMDWNNSFNTHDKYVLELELYVFIYAEDSWKHGYASWGLNMATLGNGYKLSSIVMS